MDISKLNINFVFLNKEAQNSLLKDTKGANTPNTYLKAEVQAQAAKSKEATEKPELIAYKAFFAVDENNNIVIKVVDSDGKLIRQVPPEEYIKMVEALKEITKNIFHKEV